MDLPPLFLAAQILSVSRGKLDCWKSNGICNSRGGLYHCCANTALSGTCLGSSIQYCAAGSKVRTMAPFLARPQSHYPSPQKCGLPVRLRQEWVVSISSWGLGWVGKDTQPVFPECFPGLGVQTWAHLRAEAFPVLDLLCKRSPMSRGG